MVNFARVCGSVTAAALNKLAEEKINRYAEG